MQYKARVERHSFHVLNLLQLSSTVEQLVSRVKSDVKHVTLNVYNNLRYIIKFGAWRVLFGLQSLQTHNVTELGTHNC